MSTPVNRNPKRQRQTRAGDSRRADTTKTTQTKAAPRKKRDASGDSTLAAKLSALGNYPQLDYKMLMAVTFALTGFGLMMVLSSSMVTSRAEGATVFTEFLRQGAVVIVGLTGMWFTLRVSPRTIGKYSVALIGIAFVLLILVLVPSIGVGADEVGSRSWIRIGSIGVQPSEAAKLALAVFGSWHVSRKLKETNHLGQAMGTFTVFAAVMLGLVLLQNDLGMVLTVGIVFVAIAFFAGASMLIFLFLIVSAAGVGIFSIAAAGFRGARISTWVDTFTLHFPDSTTKGAAYQSYQGILSMSDGGLTGVGLGQSRAKWSYLPEAKNDFIYAIVGEETGFIGALIVVILFALVAVFGMRTALKHTDPYMQMLAATLTAGIVLQAFYNMGYVMGYFPVTGIQLPLISAGGSSAIITLITMGLLASVARHEPETISSMQHEGRPWIDRVLFLPEPVPHQAGAQRRAERRDTTRRYGVPVTETNRQDSSRRDSMRRGQDVRRAREAEEAAIRRAGGDPQRRGYDRNRSGALPPSRRDRDHHRSSGPRREAGRRRDNYRDR